MTHEVKTWRRHVPEFGTQPISLSGIFEFIAEMTVAFGPWDSIDCAYDECMELWEDFTTSRFYTMDKSYLTCVQEFISWLETPTN